MANYKVGSFVANDVTGLQTVAHGLGTTPKALILFGSNLPATGFNNHYLLTQGFVTKDGGTFQEYSVSAASGNGVSPSNTARRMAAKAYSMVDADPVVWIEANIDSWDATNFVLNHTTVRAGSSYIINYIAIGGADVSAKVMNIDIIASAGVQSKTGAGFKPDLVLFSSALNTSGTYPFTSAGSIFEFGAMDKHGNQFTNGFNSVDAVNPSDTQRFQRTDSCIASANNDASTFAFRAAFHSMDSDGFSLNVITPAAGTRSMPVLCLKGPGMKVGAFQKTTAAAPASQGVTGVGFTPKAVLFSTMGTTPQTSPLAHARWALGATSGASSSKAVAIRDRDSQATTSAQGYQDDKAVASLNDTAASTMDFAADLTSFNTDGFTLSFTTNDAVAREILYVAFGDTPAAESAGTLSKVGSFGLSVNSAGYQQVTGLGFRPKAVILYTNLGLLDSSPGISTLGSRIGVGFSTGSGQSYSISAAAQHGVSLGRNTSRRMAEKALTVVQWGESVQLEGDLVSLDSDGFTLSWTTNAGWGGYRVNYIAIGGADLTNAKVITWAPASATAGDRAVTGIGFKPDLVFNATCKPQGGLPFMSYGGYFSFGAFDKYGNQYANGFQSYEDGNTGIPPDTRRVIRLDRCWAIPNPSSSTFQVSGKFKSMDADGFTVEQIDNDYGSYAHMALAIKGPGVKVGAFQKATATGTQAVTGTGFTPKMLITGGFGTTVTSGAVDVHAVWYLGASSGSSASRAIGAVDLDAANPSYVEQMSHDAVITASNGSGALAHSAALSSFDSNGFTLNWTTNTSGSHPIPYIAIGNAVTETAGTLTKVGSFAANTTTGHQQITGLGFRPKALILYGVENTTTGFIDSVRNFLGFTTGSSFSYSAAAYSGEALTASNTSRRMAAKAITGVNQNETLAGEADLLSLDSDGFTINITNAFSFARLINYLAIGGEDVTGARVVKWDSRTTTGIQSVTGVGFQPDLVLHASVLSETTTLPVNDTSARLTFGAMDASGNQWVNAFFSDDAKSPSDTQRYQSTAATLAQVNTTPDVNWSAAYSSLGADGFSVNWTTALAAARPVISLCIKGPRFKVGSFNKTTEAAPVSQPVTGVGFLPKGLLLSTFGRDISATPTAQVEWSLGAASGAGADKAIAVRDEDGQATTDAQGYQADKVIVDLSPAVASQVNAEASFTAFNSDGFTLNWTANQQGSTIEVLYLAIGATIQDSGFTGWGWPI